MNASPEPFLKQGATAQMGNSPMRRYYTGSDANNDG